MAPELQRLRDLIPRWVTLGSRLAVLPAPPRPIPRTPWGKLAEYRRFASAEAGLAHFASTTGIDFSRYALDEPIRYEKTNAIESATKALTVARTDATVRQP